MFAIYRFHHHRTYLYMALVGITLQEHHKYVDSIKVKFSIKTTQVIRSSVNLSQRAKACMWVYLIVISPSQIKEPVFKLISDQVIGSN